MGDEGRVGCGYQEEEALSPESWYLLRHCGPLKGVGQRKSTSQGHWSGLGLSKDLASEQQQLRALARESKEHDSWRAREVRLISSTSSVLEAAPNLVLKGYVDKVV